MNLIVKIFLASLIFSGLSVAVANPLARGTGEQVEAKTITLSDQNSPSTKPTETDQSTISPTDNKDEQAGTQAQSEESKVMEQSQSMDESMATNDNKPKTAKIYIEHEVKIF